MAQKKTVFVGLSGGVDSSVSAAILKKEGYDVVGVFLKVWQPEGIPCTWKEDRLDAMRVAAHLNIPFMTLDCEAEYKRDVVDYMIREYKAGRTPNPDVMCNKYVKFGAFFQKARELGADYIATGHYARVKTKDGVAHMYAGTDRAKDQSYFLWTLTQEELTHTLFPVGTYKTKKEVRAAAEKFGLPTAFKKDSQGLCFIGKLDMKEFLKEYIPEQSGDVLDMEGRIIGTHDGAWYVTLGQRHGFTITEKGSHDAPRYVVAKDVIHNTITVSDKQAITDGGKQAITIDHVNWIVGEPEHGKRYVAQVRYHGERHPCALEQKNNLWRVYFDHPVIMPPGQSLVLYDGNECVGGGLII